MSNNVIIHFRCEGQMYCLVFKNEADDITISMVEARICKKLAFAESSVKLKLSYIPLLVGSEEQFIISDDEDLCGYLSSVDKENRRCILYVEIMRRSELPEQLSKAGKRSSLGMNYEVLHSNDNDFGNNMNYEVLHSNDNDLGDKAITLYGGNIVVQKQSEGGIVRIEEMLEVVDEEANLDGNSGEKEDENVGEKEGESADGNVGNGREDSEIRDTHGEGNGREDSEMCDTYGEGNGREESEMRDTNGEANGREDSEMPEMPRLGYPGQFMEEWEDGLGLKIHQEFASKKAVQEVVDRGAFMKSFGFDVIKSDKERLVLKCPKKGCKWGVRAAKIKKSETFSIRTYTNMHTCSRGSESKCNSRRKGTPELVASILHDDYHGQMETPTPKSIIDLVWKRVGVTVSYSTALRGKNQAVNVLRGTPQESYQMLFCYLYMLEKVNYGTITSVELDDSEKFKYLFIALGASIEGFQVMRKVITVDATFLINGYGGVLVFATAHDPNRHHYPLAFGVLDGENKDSWSWFFEMLKSVVPDSSELVFMSDRNVSLINAIANVFPMAHHAHCIWHLAQNVKGRVSNVNKDVVECRFMDIARMYTVAEFDAAYSAFKTRYPSAAKYLEESSEKEKWARCLFPGERYNIDTSNVVESMNSVFKEARKYSLIPLLDTIVKKTADWFNEHRKETVRGSSERKLVPLVENFVHDTWEDAGKLHVSELNTFNLEYCIMGSDGKPYSVNLLAKSCSCRFFDIEKYPCIHGLATFIFFSKKGDSNHVFELEDLISKYYWTELWALSYYRTIYVVPDRSQWDVPDYIKQKKIFAPKRTEKRGRKRVKRFPSAGERRPRTQNKRRPKQSLQWLLFGNRNV